MSHASPTAVVTGAGSGIGRAVVRKLAEEGWNVALVGRRAAALEETIAQAKDVAGDRLMGFTCDISDARAVDRMRASVLERFGEVDALVNSVGINTPRRALEVLSPDDYSRLISTNLNGAYFGVQAFLPSMRRRGAGVIVNINSEAGRVATVKAGPAYVMTKFGLAGLTQSINAEERNRGIRACSIFPGDVDTPLMDQRPQPPSTEARTRMLQPSDIAACVWLVISLPPRATVEELVIRPRSSS